MSTQFKITLILQIPGYPYQPFSINGTMGTLTKGQAMEAGIK